jgi:hypothetical protein
MPVKRLLTLAALLVSIGTLSAQATVRYVNKDSSCPGSGTTGAPYCSIQNAVNAAIAGDDIRIRKASTPYNENVSTHSAGTSGSPITIESDDHANQAIWYYAGSGSLAAALQIGHSYWVAQYLDFDGSGIYTCRLAIWMTSGSVTGIKVLHNTVKNWGGSQAQRGSSAVDITSVSLQGSGELIQFNVFDGVSHYAIETGGSNNSTIDSNEFKNQGCGHNSDGEFTENAIHMTDNVDGHGAGVFSNTISNNTFHDFQGPASCTIGTLSDLAAIHIDVGPINGTISGNLVYNLPTIGNGNSVGIWVEYDAQGWTVTNNIVHDIGGTAFLNLNTPTISGRINTFTHNTTYNIGLHAMRIAGGYVTIENNIFYGTGANSGITTESRAVTDGHMIIDYNDYWDSAGGTKVGSWNSGGALNFAGWKSACGCDSHSINANPLFVSPPSDFHLQASSPVLTAGLGATFMGALGAAAGAPPNISSFTAGPSSISSGSSSILAWSTSGATSLSIDQGIGTVTGVTSRVVTPSGTTTYTLTATNGSGSVTQSVTVTVTTAALPVITSLTASPSSIYPKQSSMLSWNTSGATSLSIDQGVGMVTGTTSKSVTPSSTTIYTLTATNSNGSVTAKTTVTIAPPVISSFTANPATISPGQSSTLSWSGSGATTLSIDQGVGAVSGTTSQMVSPATTTTYTLTATSSAGSTTAKVSVAVGASSTSGKVRLILE